MSAIIIVGGGQAAGQAVARIRQNGYAGKLTLIGDEPHAPYQRPPLSKQYLAGEMGIDRVLLRPTQFYADKQVELRLGERVESIDPGAKTVILAGGDQLGYNNTATRDRRTRASPALARQRACIGSLFAQHSGCGPDSRQNGGRCQSRHYRRWLYWPGSGIRRDPARCQGHRARDGASRTGASDLRTHVGLLRAPAHKPRRTDLSPTRAPRALRTSASG